MQSKKLYSSYFSTQLIHPPARSYSFPSCMEHLATCVFLVFQGAKLRLVYCAPLWDLLPSVKFEPITNVLEAQTLSLCYAVPLHRHR